MNNTITIGANSGIFTTSSYPTIQCLVSKGAKLPQRQHHYDAGADLFAWMPEELNQEIEIYPGDQKLIDTGIAVKIPHGFVGLVYNRSSQGKKGIQIPHSVGVIDAEYRGNIKVLLKNIGEDPYKIQCNDRIAQLVVQRVELCSFVDTWNDTHRGTGGFGSTGT
jgi:dUTP pyrophosphatase